MEALKTFKKRVDTLLANFEGSAGSSSKVGDHRVSRASFSGIGKFDEATALYTQYHRVHERLTSLSKNLGMQIEALRIAVHGADVGFDNVEEELRQRFWEIQTKIDREHGEAQREQAQREKDGASERNRSDDKQSEAGY
jgi:hypothetical protein